MKYKSIILILFIFFLGLLMYFFYPVIKLNNNTTYVNIDYNPDITLSTRYKTVVPKYSIIKNIDIKK